MSPRAQDRRQPRIPQGRVADRIAMFIAIAALALSTLIMIVFWAGFYETDPGFYPASSAALLSLGLGAFALLPLGLCIRFTRSAWLGGFQPRYGYWTLFLMVPWIILGGLILFVTPLPIIIGLFAILTALTLSLWAIISLRLQNMDISD